jgi:competence protein ComGC
MRTNMRINKGFTFIELILVISIGITITFISFQQMLKNHENNQAKIAGEQIKQIGNSVNSYIAVHYDKLSSLSNSDGSTLDPGPRTCNIINPVCYITIQTLINEGLLPETYSNQNIFSSPYTLLIKRSGSAPYYNVTGLITTDNPWFGNNNNIRYDLLGKAMQEAGIDSGMTRENANVLSGYRGLWNHNNGDYSNINKQGQLGYQVGYGTYSYSIYLRRDGTLPMTGNLNMGSQSINNIKDINGSGNLTMSGKGSFGNDLIVNGSISSGTSDNILAYINNKGNIYAANNITSDKDINAGNWVWSKNQYGDVIGIGGDAIGNDYEIRLNSNKPLTIFSPNQSNGAAIFQVDGASTFSGLLQVNNAINTTGNISSNGRITTGEYLQINGIAYVGNGCSPNGLQGRDPSGALLSCVNGVWSSSTGSLKSMVWTLGSGSNYGNICQNYINNNGLAAQGWVVTGSDACTEDGGTCTTDNVKCFAVKLN